MSTRPQIKQFQAILNGNMAGNIISTISVVDNMSLFNYSFVWSGSTPVGSIAIQASNDVKILANGAIDSANPGTWNNLPLALSGSLVTSIPLSGNTGNGMIDVDAQGCYAIRAIYTATSGTGTLNCVVVGKVA